MPKATIHISNNAAARIKALAEKKGTPNLRLRVAVNGGGCSGFQYEMKLDDSQQEGDVIIAQDGAEVVTDPVSLEYLKGSTVDYVQKLGSAAFEIINPNATSSCGCGSSFNVF